MAKFSKYGNSGFNNKIVVTTLRYIYNLSENDRDRYFQKLSYKDPNKYHYYLSRYDEYIRKKNFL